MKDTVFSEREASSAEFNEREASSILRGSGLAGDELHRRRHRSTVVRRVARREVDAEHRDRLRHVNLIRREPGGLEAAEALRVVDERLYRTAERLEVVVLYQSEREGPRVAEVHFLGERRREGRVEAPARAPRALRGREGRGDEARQGARSRFIGVGVVVRQQVDAREEITGRSEAKREKVRGARFRGYRSRGV